MQFSNEQIEQWADEVSDELNALTVEQAIRAESRSLSDEPVVPLVPERLRGRLEAVAGEPAETFWVKLRAAFRKDLCIEGGYLNGEWKKYKDLPTKDVVQWTITFLSAIGVALGSSAGLAVIPVAAWILHILLNVGINAVCDDGLEPGG